MNKKNKIYKILFQTGLLSAFVALTFCYPFSNSVKANVDLSQDERQFIKDLNDFREKKGLKPLKISVKLSKAAEKMATDMKDHPDQMNHEHLDSKGRTPAQRAALVGYDDGVGENIAAGFDSADDVYKAWKGSADHYANMKAKEYKVMGIAKVIDTSSSYKWYWANMFGVASHKSDLLDENEYDEFKRLKITVTDPYGKPIKKAKIYILDEHRNKDGSGKTNSKGRITLYGDPKYDYAYIKAIASGYQSYTKRIKFGTKDTMEIRMWLEKN